MASVDSAAQHHAATATAAPQTQAEKFGFNIDESLATSYVGKYTLYHTIGEGAFGK